MNSVTIILSLAVLAILTAVIYALKVTRITIGTEGGKDQESKKTGRDLLRYF